jgi:hypothetical protein
MELPEIGASFCKELIKQGLDRDRTLENLISLCATDIRG